MSVFSIAMTAFEVIPGSAAVRVVASSGLFLERRGAWNVMINDPLYRIGAVVFF